MTTYEIFMQGIQSSGYKNKKNSKKGTIPNNKVLISLFLIMDTNLLLK